MRVVITGGTGFIGSRLAKSLLEDGHEVIVLSRAPKRTGGDAPKGVELVKWDAQTAEGWAQHADGADAIVNLAAYPIDGPGALPKPWTDERRELIRQSRLNTGQAVVEAIRQVDNKPGVLIQASAVGYYGPRGDEVVLESSDPGRDFLAQVCVEWEEVTEPVEEMGVRRVVIRTGLPMSMEGGAFPFLVLPIKYFTMAGPLGNGEQWYPWIHIDDVVKGIRFLIDNEEARGAFNLTAPAPHMQKDIASAIGRVLGRPAFFPVPGFIMRLALGEVTTVVLEGQRAVPEKLRGLGFEWQYPELDGALRDLLG